MPCCAGIKRLLLALALWCATAWAYGADIVAERAALELGEEGYALMADFRVNLNQRLEEAINKGVVLYFATEFELTRSRWYWLDEKVVQRSRTFQLSYHALTRQYRLSSGALHLSFETLDEAMRVLSHQRHWLVADRAQIAPDGEYLASARLRLDASLMAKTFQVSALLNRDWNLSSEWLRWKFSPTDAHTAGETR